MAQSTAAKWTLKGTVLIACNCDYGCPCNFNALPTNGDCEGGWAWHVQDGRYGDTDLGGLSFCIAADWPKAIHDGNGEAAVLIDKRANEVQREALRTLVSGAAGGPWGILKNTWTTVHEPRYVIFEMHLAEQRSRAKAGDLFELEMEPITNPVTGAEVTPGAVLPAGLHYKRPTFRGVEVLPRTRRCALRPQRQVRRSRIVRVQRPLMPRSTHWTRAEVGNGARAVR